LSELHSVAETYFVPIQLALAMLGMGATLSARDFLQVLRDPRGLALGLALQLIVVPAAAFGFIEIFDLSPGWAVGLCLVAVVPGGAFSNLLTFLGKGNVALSISVTAASTAACMFTVPLLLQVLASSYLPESFDLPLGRIILEITGYLLVPLIIGMVVFRLWPRTAPTVARWSIRGAVLLIVLITISALQSGRIEVGAYGWGPPLIIVAFGVALAHLTPLLVRAARHYDDDNVALTIEVAVRNIGIALLLVRFFFPGQPEQGQVLYTCLFYAGLSGFVAVPVVLLHRFDRPIVVLLSKRSRPQ